MKCSTSLEQHDAVAQTVQEQRTLLHLAGVGTGRVPYRPAEVFTGAKGSAGPQHSRKAKAASARFA